MGHRGRKRPNPVAFPPTDNPIVFSRGLRTLPAYMHKHLQRAFGARVGTWPAKGHPSTPPGLGLPARPQQVQGWPKGGRPPGAAPVALQSRRRPTWTWLPGAAERGRCLPGRCRGSGGLGMLPGACLPSARWGPRGWPPSASTASDGAVPVPKRRAGRGAGRQHVPGCLRGLPPPSPAARAQPPWPRWLRGRRAQPQRCPRRYALLYAASAVPPKASSSTSPSVSPGLRRRQPPGEPRSPLRGVADLSAASALP